MSIKKYSTFLKVVETGSITKAATALGHTQSGVTQLLASLEQDLGAKLLTRSRSGISLTEEGHTLLPYIKEVVTSNEALLQAASGLHTPGEQVIRVGAFTSVAVNWLPTIIKEYQQKVPDVRFELIDCGYNEIARKLQSNKMDLGFVPSYASKELESIPLYEDRLLAVLPSDHPFFTEHTAKDNFLASFPVSRFSSDPVISLIPEIDLDARTVFRKAGIIPNTKYTVEDDYAMLALAKKGLGICIVPELMLLSNDLTGITAIELNPPASRTIGIAFPTGKTPSAVAQDFASFIQEWVLTKNKTERKDYNYVDCK